MLFFFLVSTKIFNQDRCSNWIVFLFFIWYHIEILGETKSFLA